MLGGTISTVTTPLALAALALLLGAGIVRLILRNKPSGASKTVVQYGFWLAVTVSVLANLVFAYQVSLQAESLISGSVRNDDGDYLSHAIVDIRGTARAITDDNGSFIMSIPRSRMEDSYELDVSLKGYDLKTVTVKSGERMAKVTLSLKQLLPAELISVSPNVIIGHYLGFPQVDLEVTMSNPTINEVSVSDVLLTVTPRDEPDEKRTLPWQLFYLADGMPYMPRYEPRSIASNEMRKESYVFIEHFRADILQFDQHIKDEISNIGIQNMRMDRSIISEELTYALRQDMEARWFWNPGSYELVYSCTVDGKRYHATGTVQLSHKDVVEMKNISKYYDSGFGLSFGFHYMLIGDARPALITQSNFVYTEPE